MPDADRPTNIKDYEARIIAAEHADLPQRVSEARNALTETEWTELIGVVSAAIDNTMHPVNAGIKMGQPPV